MTRDFNSHPRALRGLVNVLYAKICATALFWCVPLLLFPTNLLELLGFPPQSPWMFVRLLGWAYLALCVGYAFALIEAQRGHRLVGAIWVGIVSNGGACAWLFFYGLTCSWTAWGQLAKVILWGSAVSTALVTFSLIRYGLRSP